MSKKLFVIVSLLPLALLSLTAEKTLAAQVTKSIEEMLRKLKLDRAILANLDRELQVPAEWIEKAKKEGGVRVLGTLRAERVKDSFRRF